MRYQLRIAEAVWSQADEVDSWWRVNRRGAPRLFREELLAALARIEAAPSAARPYGHEGQPSTLRRVLLPRSPWRTTRTNARDSAVALHRGDIEPSLSSMANDPEHLDPARAPARSSSLAKRTLVRSRQARRAMTCFAGRTATSCSLTSA